MQLLATPRSIIVNMTPPNGVSTGPDGTDSETNHSARARYQSHRPLDLSNENTGVLSFPVGGIKCFISTVVVA